MKDNKIQKLTRVVLAYQQLVEGKRQLKAIDLAIKLNEPALDFLRLTSDEKQEKIQRHKVIEQDLFDEGRELFDEDGERGEAVWSARTTSYISDHETRNEGSHYCRIRKNQVKDLSKILAKEILTKANKKAMMLLQNAEIAAEAREKSLKDGQPAHGSRNKTLLDNLMQQFDMGWINSSERFRNKRSKQILTIKVKSQDEIDDYRRQERLRYSQPLQPFIFEQNGKKYVVGPCLNRKAQWKSLPSVHLLLKNDRPPQCSVLSLVRDAVSRLPDGVGTRTDVVELVKESQWISQQGLEDENLQHATFGGGLDRLQAEDDPGCCYHSSTRLWVNLHFRRKIDDKRFDYEELKMIDISRNRQRVKEVVSPKENITPQTSQPPANFQNQISGLSSSIIQKINEQQ